MNICIIGGGGGATNAANQIRILDKQARIDIFTNRDDIGNLPCEIPYVLNGTLPTWESSFTFKEKFYKERHIEVHMNSEVTGINLKDKLLVAGDKSYHYDKAILDLGSTPIIPPIPGLDGYNEFVLTTWTKHGRIFEQAIPKYKRAAVIGAGQIALEVAEMLQIKGYEQVYLLGRSDQVLRAYFDADMAAMMEKAARDKGIEVILPAGIEKVATVNGHKVITLKDREITVDLVFLGVGAAPNTELAKKAGIRLGKTGAIAVNEYLQTSDPDIFAIGDCMENRERVTGASIVYQTAANSATTGRVAARNLMLGNVTAFPGTTLAFVTECFGCQAGTVGLTSSRAREKGIDFIASTTVSATRRRLFGGKTMHIKLIADRATRTLAGAQIIGEELVAGKIDKLSVAVAEKITTDRLALIDTCYSPTVGAAYDALTMALDDLNAKLG